MDLVLLTETIIKKIVTDPESVSVKEFQTDEENEIQIEVLISSDDMGKVINEIDVPAEYKDEVEKKSSLAWEKHKFTKNKKSVIQILFWYRKLFKLIKLSQK